MLKINVFHLDDDLFEHYRVREALAEPQGLAEFIVHSFSDPGLFMEKVADYHGPILALVDVHLGPHAACSGPDLISKFRKANPRATVVMFSSDVASIRDCLRREADDFVLKSDNLEDLALRLFSIFRNHDTYEAADHLPRPQAANIIGETMRQISERVRRIAGSAVRSVYVTGPSGTGKEVVADMLRGFLPERTPFVKVNCAAIAPSLLESELFGYVKGAFTGALTSRIGLLEAATGGWVYLDEVACLSVSAQAALLRAIENQEVVRVGESSPRHINVRFISATNTPLETMTGSGAFRNDLLQRLREAEIKIPSLNHRPKELNEFIDYFCKTEAGGPYRITDEARRILQAVDWTQGNVRAVRNCIRAMTEQHKDKLLVPKGIPNWIWDLHQGVIDKNTEVVSLGKQLVVPLPDGDMPSFETLSDMLLAVTIEMMLTQPGLSSLRKIASALGLARTTLSYRIKRLSDQGLLNSTAVAQLFDGKKDAS